MRILNLVVALFFVFSLCLSPLTDANAASSSAKKTEKSVKKSNKAKASKKEKNAKSKAEKKPKADKKSKKAKDVKKAKPQKKLPAAKSISINKADKKELMMLPGIGPKMADAIIKYRKANKFKSIEDLKKVKGIGDKTFAKLKKYLKP